MRLAFTIMVLVAVTFTTLFSSGQTFTNIYNFGSNAADGVDPQPGVVFDKTGNLYGVASVGGASGANGMVFELTPPGIDGAFWIETIIHQFSGKPDGAVSEGRLVVTTSGALFGTTWAGGTQNLGSIFEAIPPATAGGLWRQKVLYSFGQAPGDGVNPNAALLPAKPGFYGVTSGGGINGKGTVFQLSPPASAGDPWTEKVLYSFKSTNDAAFPSSELVMDKSGNLYGTTTLGGTNSDGAVYRLSPPVKPGDSWTETVLYAFSGPDGSLPAGRLQLNADGSLYGTTAGGGALGSGTVFQLTPPAQGGGSWTETVLYSFSGGSADGGSPSAGVIADKHGHLYGTAQHGGAGGGVVFRLDPPSNGSASWAETILHSFSGPDGFTPSSTLALHNGRLYGTTTQGGVFGTGTVFELLP